MAIREREEIKDIKIGKEEVKLSLNIQRWYGHPWGFPGGTLIKNPPANAEDERYEGLSPELGRPPGGGNGNPL